MKVAFGSDERTHLTDAILAWLEKRGHGAILSGALAGGPPDWPDVAFEVGRAVSEGACGEGIVCCWTGTGASIAANKVRGVRAALCADAETARGARTWNHANVLVLSLRLTSEAVAAEILEAWFSTPFGDDEWDLRQVEKVAAAEGKGDDQQPGGEEDRLMKPGGDTGAPVCVYTASNRLEAEVIRSLLDAEGIPASLSYESVGVVYGLTVDGMGETRVLVPPALEAEARTVIAQHEESLDGAAI